MNSLKHYSSPYYDPVKAHEYYMKNRELKGRKSTSGLNEEGRNAASYVKSRINEEKKSKIEELKNKKKNDINSYSNSVKIKISSLKESLKSMSKSQRARNKDRINREIASLRADNQKQRAALQESYKTLISKTNEEYENKYINELDKMKKESKFQKQKTSSSKSKSSSSSSSKGVKLNVV